MFIDALNGLCARFAHKFCFVSHLTCTNTPGRNGHLGGLFGISGTDGRDADVSAAVCADKTLFVPTNTFNFRGFCGCFFFVLFQSKFQFVCFVTFSI